MAFPNNPSNGDTFVRYGRTYQYDSAMLMWKVPKSGILLGELADIDITTNPPIVGDALRWSGSKFEPETINTVTVYQTDLPLTGNTVGDMAYITDLSSLYIFNGGGWFNVAIINTNPTITTGPDGSYTFALDGTPTVITLVAEDPEGLPITWSYAVTTGSLGTTATVAQADNVFTITPSTNSADQGNFGITFTASDGVNLATAASSFTLEFGALIEYLVVAGGGGGGGKVAGNAYGGGGAGAGGFRTATGLLVDFGSAITVTVGAGGAGGIGVQGSSGFDSVFSTITSNGGGYGAKGSVAASAEVGGDGGSGGAGTYLALSGSGIAGQGFKGGTDSNATGGGSPGGGGASAQGVDITSGQLAGSAGGAGLYSSISGTNIAYAGGGGGGAYGTSASSIAGLGGAGGGGNGGTSGVGPAAGTGPGGAGNGGNGLGGSANLGGGGGGCFSTSNAALGIGGAGGSGVVIVRYPGGTRATGGTITSSGGYTIHTFTSSGAFQLNT
jgi:hypothetical protein